MILVVIVPFLNEEQHLGALLESLAGQTRPADRILLVDDGSTDGSYEIACSFAEDRDSVEVLRRPQRAAAPDRLASGSALHAFQWGLERVPERWDIAAKLDADLRLTPSTLEILERRFEADPGLGIAGTYLREQGRDGEWHRLKCGPHHVHGATKFYRRACYEAVFPLHVGLGWDITDEATARLRGWRTGSTAMPEGDPLHLRVRGSYDGSLRAWRRWGMCAYALGEAPLHVLLYSLMGMTARPRVVGGVNFAFGWVLGGAQRLPRADPEIRAAVRDDQLRRIKRRFANLGRRVDTAS